jgi:mitochondrial fission protein ELM1
MKKVLLLNDGKLGHFNQTKALSYALNHIVDTHTQTIHIKIKKSAKYLLRGLLNSTIGTRYLSNPNALKWIGFFYDIDEEITKYDIIISSGKDTSLLNAWLGLVYGCQTIYIGNPKKLNHRLFNRIFSVLDLGFDNQIVLDMAPTMPLQVDIDLFCREYRLNKNDRYYTLLIGGDGSGYRYSIDDYQKLIALVNNTPKEIKWLITTSRRTPKEIEEMLLKQMKCAYFVAYHQNPQKVVAPFLTLSQVVFVTQESASMIGEAISSQKKVVTLKPNGAKIEENYQKILDKYIKSKAMVSLDIDAIDEFDMDRFDIMPFEHNSIWELKEKLKEII